MAAKRRLLQLSYCQVSKRSFVIMVAPIVTLLNYSAMLIVCDLDYKTAQGGDNDQ